MNRPKKRLKRQQPNSKAVDLDTSELRRLQGLLIYEQEARANGSRRIAGVDEAGRGPLAGPVVAAACIIPEGILFAGINDSKKLSPQKREALFYAISDHPDISYGIGLVDHVEIDRVNIYQATLQAMSKAVAALREPPDCLLVDGMQFSMAGVTVKKIVRGDSLSQSIAAASILAKVTRDKMMEEFDKQWPQYGFKNHKGYGTEEHLAALAKHGACPIHRRTFGPCSLGQTLRTGKK